MKNKYLNREISWLDFNSRVLQEASDINVPIIETIIPEPAIIRGNKTKSSDP